MQLNYRGIIALALVLVYSLAVVLAFQGSFQPNERTILVWFLVIYPVLVLAAFLWLVTQNHNKLYAPSDFEDETNFMKMIQYSIEHSPKLLAVEDLTRKIQAEIDNQPLYSYTKLTEAGKRAIPGAVNHTSGTIAQLTDRPKEPFQRDEVEQQLEILGDKYGWILREADNFRITEKGRRDMETFLDLVYGRLK